MKRRQFGATLATATLSLGTIAGAATSTSAKGTDSLRAEDVCVSLAGVTTTVGHATFEYEDGTMVLRAEDWTMDDGERSLSIAAASVSVADVSVETFATVRAGLKEGFEGRSLSPLLTALAEANARPDSSVTVSLEAIALDGTLVADQLTATGTAGSVVPEGTRALLEDGTTLAELDALGPSEWSQLTVERGDAELTANDVSIELDGATVSITSPTGKANVSGRTFEFSGIGMTVLPPETISVDYVEFVSKLRQLAKSGNLTLPAVDSAVDESGVAASNTFETLLRARVILSFERVTRGSGNLITNFETSTTLAELVQVLGRQSEEAGEGEEKLSKKVVVSHPDRESVNRPDEYERYAFEVDGNLEELEPNEDTDHAVDGVTRADGTVRVEGSVGTGDDQFAFSGDLTEIDTSDVVLRIEER